MASQQAFLEDYAQRNGFTNVRHFTDDGVSGTTFDRDGFKAMIAEVEAGNVSTIIVKDSCVIIGPNQKGSKRLGFSGLVPSFLTEKRTNKTVEAAQTELYRRFRSRKEWKLLQMER